VVTYPAVEQVEAGWRKRDAVSTSRALFILGQVL
jgi:hypothetical protein